MGLDVIEFIMKVEEEFEVSIPDPIASEMRTGRHVIEYLAIQLNASRKTGTCVSQQAFFRLRQTLMRCLGIERHRIRPSSELEDLVPREDRSKNWRRLRHELALPDLERPPMLGWIICFISLSVGWSSFVLLLLVGAELGLSLACGILFAGCLAWQCHFMTEPNRIEFPRELQRISGLVYFLAPVSVSSPPKVGTRWTRDQIKHKVVTVMCEEFGLRYGTFSEDSRFNEDLGIS